MKKCMFVLMGRISISVTEICLLYVCHFLLFLQYAHVACSKFYSQYVSKTYARFVTFLRIIYVLHMSNPLTFELN